MELVTIEALAGADCGNSTTKSILRFGNVVKARKQPTIYAYLPVVPQFEDEDLDTLVANLHKNMVVNITSKAVRRNGLFAVGDIATINGGDGFNIKQHKKSEMDLTVIQPLSMIATAAIQTVYKENGELPGTLEINLKYDTAIPVVDYSKADAMALENRLKDTHVLIVYVGEGHRVTVTINIKEAKVVQEGIPAFYALINGSPEMFAAYNAKYGLNFTGKSFAKRKILFVDIGDGTLELIFVEEGRPKAKKSRGYRYGVGHASELAIKAFKDQYNLRGNITRTHFMDKINNVNDKWHNEAARTLHDAKYDQQYKILDAIAETVENVLTYDLDDIVVMGGGTNVFTELYDMIVNYAERYKLKVLWIDGKIASLMNVYGLDELNTKMFFAAKEKLTP